MAVPWSLWEWIHIRDLCATGPLGHLLRNASQTRDRRAAGGQTRDTWATGPPATGPEGALGPR